MLTLTLTRLAGWVDVPVPKCSSLLYRLVSLSSRSQKKSSPYSSFDSERYSSLVRSVMSSRVSSQTPESLHAEDEHVYGPVVQAAAPSASQVRTPKIQHPFKHDQDFSTTTEPEKCRPLRISLNWIQGKWSPPSVTRIIQQTMSPEQIFYLERWRKNMIAELGEIGFREYSQNLFRQGKLFHSAVEKILESGAAQRDTDLPGEDSPAFPIEIAGYMTSISHILKDVSDPGAIESAVQHDTLNYRGVVDCVARYKGVLCVIDWKTSEKPKPFLSNTYDNPIQVAAYAGALNSDKNYNYQVENGLIVIAYKDGSPAHAHQLDQEMMLDYWRKWLLRLEDFSEQKSGDSSNAENK
ncbi:mitochondrial genome maintenance exonuclease 1 isoform X1 [Synchiropus splendidus]|uniref:mitochondrial genome maintenance exonuclease 1 isoform X1 n=2 Tax=Synchiropus splendidus TaxID=270530 RepID=UPI00237D85F8|nr:mitochondrial genome maintenance exonuclease 1 isoform X1 [Synchiropus splendidus]